MCVGRILARSRRQGGNPAGGGHFRFGQYFWRNSLLWMAALSSAVAARLFIPDEYRCLPIPEWLSEWHYRNAG
jgi:hypothetical protein